MSHFILNYCKYYRYILPLYNTRNSSFMNKIIIVCFRQYNGLDIYVKLKSLQVFNLGLLTSVINYCFPSNLITLLKPENSRKVNNSITDNMSSIYYQSPAKPN